MKGISYLTDEAGKRTAVVIDLQFYGEHIESMLQTLIKQEKLESFIENDNLFPTRKDPLQSRSIINYQISDSEKGQHPYSHIDNPSEYIRNLRASEWYWRNTVCPTRPKSLIC